MKRRMKYYVISGRVVEEKRSWLSTDPQYRKPRGTRRAGASSERKIKANEKSSVKALARILNCNCRPGDAFLTLKYDAGHYPGSSRAEENVPGSEGYTHAERILDRYLRKVRAEYRKETGRSPLYVRVTANWSPHRDAPARLHHHLVLPADAFEIARRLWQSFGGEGTVMLRELDSRGDYSDLAAYLAANVHGGQAGKKHWSCSRGMEKPIITEPEEIDDIEDVQAIPGGIVKDVEETKDEDGRVIGKYMRCLLPARPTVRGSQIILPKPKRGGHRREG